MARFHGKVGYVENQEVSPGVWKDVPKEVIYFGDVVKNSVAIREAEKVNDDLTTGNSIRIMADPYAHENFSAIRYLEWAGVLWKVTSVVEEYPRLLLRLGGVYNGPKVEVP